MTTVPIRLIGVSGGGAPQNTRPQQEAGIVVANPQQAEQRLQNASQYRQDAARTQVDAIGKSMEAISAEISARTNSDNRIAQALGGLGAVAQVVTEWSSKRQQLQIERRDELEAELSSEQHVAALDQAQTILDQSRGIITELGYEKGVEQVREMFTQTLGQFPNLDPEALRQVQTTVFNELRNINGEMWRNQERELEEVNQTRRSVVLATARAEAGQALGALRYRGSDAPYEEKVEYMRQIVSSLTDNEEYQKLSPNTQLSIYAEFLEYAVDALGDNEDAVQLAQGELERTQGSQNMLQQAQVAYENGAIDYQQLQRVIQETNIANRTSASPISVFDQLGQMMKESEVWNDYNQMQQDKLYAEAGPLADIEVGNVVANILAGRMSEAQIEDNPFGDQVKDALQLYRTQYEGRYDPAQKRIIELQSERTSVARELQMAAQYQQAWQGASEEERKAGLGFPGEFKRAFDNINSNRQRLAEIDTEVQRGHQELLEIRQQLIPYGLAQGYQNQAQMYNHPEMVRRREEAEAIRAEANARGTQSFNYGTQAQNGPAPRPLATLAAGRFGMQPGAFVPFVAGTENVVITSGWSGHAGGRAGHGGIDFAPPSGQAAPAVASVRTGRVFQAGWSDSWGNHVIVEDAEGHRAVYAHLTATPDVKTGDVVSQGQRLGVMGNTGQSRGAHLHFSVMRPGAASEGQGTVDPIAYINNSVAEPSQPVLGAGIPPHGQSGSTSARSGGTPGSPGTPFVSDTPIQVSNTAPPPGAFILPEQNGWVYGNTMFFRTQEDADRARSRRQAQGGRRQIATPGTLGTIEGAPQGGPIAPTSNTFDGANPQRNGQVSGFKRDYGRNNPEHNFGYRALQDDREFRLALHATATRLNLPAQWIADVIAFETGGTFSPNERNGAGSGATGLIQFMPATARGLGTSTDALSRMTRAQQMRYVENYLKPYAGKINTITDMYMSVLYPAAMGKAPGEVLFQRGTTAYRQNSGLDLNGDGRITVEEAARKIGPHGGRRYEFNTTSANSEVIHERLHAGCPSCAAFQQAQASTFVPHMGVA